MVVSKLKTSGKTLARFWAYEYMDIDIVKRYVMGMIDREQKAFFAEVKKMKLESDAEMQALRESLRKDLFGKTTQYE